MEPDIVVKLVGQVIFWCGFILVLCMLRRYLCFAISIAAAEVLKGAPESVQEKMLRWFANGEEIREELQSIREKIK